MRTSKTISVSLPPEQYEQKHGAPINYDLIAALRAVQSGAKRAGLDKLTEREIDAEVTASRREKDRKTKQPVR
jgi:hypothetical protein